MKILALSLAFLFILGNSAWAATLEWSRNAEADMSHYNLYYCPTAGCVVEKTAAMKQIPTVVQPAVGVKPTLTFTMGVGSAAVTAVDRSGNESPLSNQASLPVKDTTAPAAPGSFTVR